MDGQTQGGAACVEGERILTRKKKMWPDRRGTWKEEEGVRTMKRGRRWKKQNEEGGCVTDKEEARRTANNKEEEGRG